MNGITLSLIEIFISLVVETIILGGLFTWVANKTNQKMEQQLRGEMQKIENQNKLIYQELNRSIKDTRNDIISQIKESAGGQN
jgi:Tfp pilus assembly protein PilV